MTPPGYIRCPAHRLIIPPGQRCTAAGCDQQAPGNWCAECRQYQPPGIDCPYPDKRCAGWGMPIAAG